MVLRRIFGPKRDEVKGEWRKLHNEELRDLYSSPSMIRIIKSKGMEDQDVGGWIILGWILERWDGVMWTGLLWLRIGTGGELLCEFVIEPSGSIKCWETIEWPFEQCSGP
jgi:hypothetical protein